MNDSRALDRKAPGLAPRMLTVYWAVDTIIRRREALTGGRPRHAVRACSLDDLAREAEAANAR